MFLHTCGFRPKKSIVDFRRHFKNPIQIHRKTSMLLIFKSFCCVFVVDIHCESLQFSMYVAGVKFMVNMQQNLQQNPCITHVELLWICGQIRRQHFHNSYFAMFLIGCLLAPLCSTVQYYIFCTAKNLCQD